MNISVIDNQGILTSGKTAAETAKTAAAEQKAIDNALNKTENAEIKDQFIKSNNNEQQSGIYSKESILEQLRNSEEQRINAFKETIKSMLLQQGQTPNFMFQGNALYVTEENRQAAEKSISDEGEYSVDAVAGRIMDMAKALSGNDETKIGLLKDAVIKGFGKAASALGKKEDNMPEITKKTYTEVMNRFDDWENSFKPESKEEKSV